MVHGVHGWHPCISSLVSISIPHIKLASWDFFPVSQCHFNYFISSGIMSLMTCHLRLLWNTQQGTCNPSIASTNTTANTTFLLAQVFFFGPLGSNFKGVPKRPKTHVIQKFTSLHGNSHWILPNICNSLDDFCLKKKDDYFLTVNQGWCPNP